MKWVSFLLTFVLAVASVQVEAKRMGFGRSVGTPSQNVMPRQATPSAAQAAPAAAKPGAAAATQPRRWGGLLGGLAAGLGLAWLASSLGLGEAFGNILLIGLMVMGGLLLLSFLMRRRMPQPAGAGAGAGVGQAQETLRTYNPQQVGNDASARPWEQGDGAATPSSRVGSRIGSRLIGGGDWTIPDDFDVAGFVSAAKQHFVVMQAHWDKGDLNALRSLMTDEMHHEIAQQLKERETLVNGPNHTEVISLNAQLLGIEDLGSGHMASVEFSGMISEDAFSGPTPFREVWNMTKPKDSSSGWVVAGIQALQ